MIPDDFFDRDACALARDLLGAVLRRRLGAVWVAAVIVETEAYYRDERASHASLGRTPSREPTFMAPGTLYLYHSRAGASLNLSARGEGDAVLIKAGMPWTAGISPGALEAMHAANPGPRGRRPDHRLCAGQTLLCRALGLRVADWTGRRFDPDAFWLEAGPPRAALRTTRLGIPPGRDEHLPYRFVDADRVRSATRPPRDAVRVPAGAPVAPVHRER